MFDNIRQDLAAHRGDWGAQGFWALVVYRFGRWRYGVRPALLRKPLSLIYRVLYKAVQVVTGIELPCEVPLGRGFVIDHAGGIVISGYARFGSHCRIRNGVVVGLATVGEPCAPVIGDHVDIGAGAKLLGPIRIGNHVCIGANAVVLQDVPDHCIAVGVPAVVKPRRTAAAAQPLGVLVVSAWTETLLVLAVLPLLLPALALLALTLSATGRRDGAGRTEDNDGDDGAGPAPRVAVLVPAHNESGHLLPTLRNLQAQLSPGDRLLVVADNCSDDTAAVARAAGAEVSERHDALRRGKGYALAHGVAALRADPPDVVLVVDADCQLTEGSLARIGRACQASGRPVQMLNLMAAPAGAGPRLRIAEFAMVMKNHVRPLGTQRLGGVCHLMGTGMALPWALMADAPLATGHVAEDMLMGIVLTRGGHAPLFLPTARVASQFVDDAAALRRQKARWEHGHLDTLRHELPALLRAALRQRSRALAVLALDLCIPPVALYFSGLLALGAVAAAAAWALPAVRPAAALLGVGGAAFGLAVGLAWWRFARPLLRPVELLRAPLYALWKLPVYVAYALGLRSGWVRTPRTTTLAEPRR